MGIRVEWRWDFRLPSYPRLRESSQWLKRLDTRIRGYDDIRQISEYPDHEAIIPSAPG